MKKKFKIKLMECINITSFICLNYSTDLIVVDNFFFQFTNLDCLKNIST